MKNPTKKILILIFLMSSAIYAVFGQSDVSVFNEHVLVQVPVNKREFATGYPLSLGAQHLKECAARNVSTADLTKIFNAVSNEMEQPDPPMGIPVLGAFFTTQTGDDPLKIVRSKTHGFCFAVHFENTLTVYYYEKSDNDKFVRVDNLTTRINSYSENLFIALHYSSFSPGTYPEESTIFTFFCDTLGKVTQVDSSDLFVNLSRDCKRQTGLYALGMADSSILAGCESPNGGTSNCGNDCHMAVENTHCLVTTDNWGTTYYDCIPGVGHCAAGVLDRKARNENVLIGVPIKFKMMRDFRDKFMIQYCEGRKYTGFYYVFSKYAKMSISMLWKYASVLSELYSAMENLSDESTDKVIFTPSLREKVLEILHDHNDVGNPYFQSILVEVEKDMEKFTGLKRSEVIAMLSPYGSCSGQRQALAEQSGDNPYYAAVYDNPGYHEIVVNYSVSGSRIKFELFSTTARLISSINDAPPQQKLSISTSKLDPGIYLYRISSDSGYEKVGKVSVIN